MADLLQRPELDFAHLAHFAQCPSLPPEVVEQVEISVKYAGYVERQQRQVAELHKLEDIQIPEDIDYLKIHGLRTEARERLNAVRPINLPGGPHFWGFTCGRKCFGRCAQGREEVCLIEIGAMMLLWLAQGTQAAKRALQLRA